MTIHFDKRSTSVQAAVLGMMAWIPSYLKPFACYQQCYCANSLAMYTSLNSGDRKMFVLPVEKLSCDLK